MCKPCITVKYQDYGLLLGFITEKHGTPAIESTYKSCKEVFSKYRQNLLKNINNLHPGKQPLYFKHLYIPKFFQLWGSFDIGFIVAIDDFDILNYLHKIAGVSIPQYLVGYLPYQDNDPTVFIDPLTELIKKRDTVAEQPLVGICRIKISSFLKLVTGNKIKPFILDYIRHLIAEFCQQPPQIDISAVVLETMNWNEFTVIIFSNDYELISKLVSTLRQPTVNSLRKWGGNPNTESMQHIIEEIEICNFMSGSMAGDVNSVHLFSATNTILGFDYQLARSYKSPNNKDVFNKIKGSIAPLSLLTIKPGHDYMCDQVYRYDLPQVSDADLDDVDDKKTIIFFGKGDIPIVPESIKKLIRTELFIKIYLDRIRHVSNQKSKENNSHIYRVNTIIGVEIDLAKNKLKNHKSLNIHLEHLTFQDDSKSLYSLFLEELTRIGIPSAMRSNIVKTVSLFNPFIEDPLTFDELLELRPYLVRIFDILDKFIDEIANCCELTIKDFTITEDVAVLFSYLEEDGIVNVTDVDKNDFKEMLTLINKSLSLSGRDITEEKDCLDNRNIILEKYKKCIEISAESISLEDVCNKDDKERQNRLINELTEINNAIEHLASHGETHYFLKLSGAFKRRRARCLIEFLHMDCIPPSTFDYFDFKRNLENMANKFTHGLNFFEPALIARLAVTDRYFENNNFSSDGLEGMYAFVSALDGFLKCQQATFPKEEQAGFAFYSPCPGATIHSAMAPLVEFSAHKLIQFTGMLFTPHEFFHYMQHMGQDENHVPYLNIFQGYFTGVKISKQRLLENCLAEQKLIADPLGSIIKNNKIFSGVESYVNECDATAHDVLCDIYCIDSTFNGNFKLFSKFYWTMYALPPDDDTEYNHYSIARYLALNYTYDNDFNKQYNRLALRQKPSDGQTIDYDYIKLFRRVLNDYSCYNKELYMLLSANVEDCSAAWVFIWEIFTDMLKCYGELFIQLQQLIDKETEGERNYYTHAHGDSMAVKNLKKMKKGMVIPPDMPGTAAISMKPRLFSNVLANSFAYWLFDENDDVHYNKRAVKDPVSGLFTQGILDKRRKLSEILVDNEGRVIPITFEKRREFFLLRLSLINSLINQGAELKWQNCKKDLLKNKNAVNHRKKLKCPGCP